MLSRFRSGWLVDELARRANRGNDPEVLRWRELRRRLAALLHQAEGQDEPRVRRFRATFHHELEGVERQLRDSELTMARRRPGLLPAGPGESVSRRLLDRLPNGHVFVEYFLDSHDLLTFVARQGSLRVQRTPVAAEVRQLVAAGEAPLLKVVGTRIVGNGARLIRAGGVVVLTGQSAAALGERAGGDRSRHRVATGRRGSGARIDLDGQPVMSADDPEVRGLIVEFTADGFRLDADSPQEVLPGWWAEIEALLDLAGGFTALEVRTDDRESASP